MGNTVRALFGAVVFLGVLGFFLTGLLPRTRRVSPAEKDQFRGLDGVKRHHFHRGMDLNYVNKRRVPSGPDPIHNRRAEKFRQPPGV